MISLDVVVADNDSVDGTRELVESDFPDARVVTCRNHGFGHANNQGLATTSSRYVLFLNPDTEILEGTFADLVAMLDRDEEIGLVGVKQLAGDGELFPTIRRFPSLSRYLFESPCVRPEVSTSRIVAGRARARHDGVRARGFLRLDVGLLHARASGSSRHRGLFRRAVLPLLGRGGSLLADSPGRLGHSPSPCDDDRPSLQQGRISPRILSQDAFARKQYLDKHFSSGSRLACTGALWLRHGLRAIPVGRDRQHARLRSEASRRALRVLAGASPPPFGQPPPTAMISRRESEPVVAADSRSGR